MKDLLTFPIHLLELCPEREDQLGVCCDEGTFQSSLLLRTLDSLPRPLGRGLSSETYKWPPTRTLERFCPTPGLCVGLTQLSFSSTHLEKEPAEPRLGPSPPFPPSPVQTKALCLPGW